MELYVSSLRIVVRMLTLSPLARIDCFDKNGSAQTYRIGSWSTKSHVRLVVPLTYGVMFMLSSFVPVNPSAGLHCANA